MRAPLVDNDAPLIARVLTVATRTETVLEPGSQPLVDTPVFPSWQRKISFNYSPWRRQSVGLDAPWIALVSHGTY
jgi:hypothetical protein